MKPIEPKTPHAGARIVVLAKDQPQYDPLPCAVDANGLVMTEWELSAEELGLHQILADLAGLGFDAEWDVLPAAAFGSPQLRARIWILAYPCGYRKSANDTIFAGRPEFDGDGRWSAEPALDRVADGFPGWLVGALGDAVCPPVAEWIFRRIKEAEGLT